MNVRRGKFVWTALLVVTFAGLGARVVWHAATTETGWQFLEEQARWATIGWFIEPEPIVHRLPPEQAEFWLERTEEVLRRHPDDAEVAMGAALMLHHPDNRYQWKMIVEAIPGSKLAQSTLDQDRIENLQREFDSLCRERCLELAERATRLEPDNLAWWRLRAFLISPRYHQQDDFETRIPDWEEVLQTCAEHDPDNAYYDYLTAGLHWEAGGTLVPVGIPDLVVEVDDPERWAAGQAAFEKGQAKPLLALGREGYRAVAKFVDRARLSSTELPVTKKGSLPGTREMHVAETVLLRNLHRWQYARAITDAGEGGDSASFDRYQEMRRILEQHAKGDASSESDNFHLFSARAMASALLELALDHPELVKGNQLRQLNAAKRRAEFNYHAYERAGVNVEQQATAEKATGPFMERRPTVRVILAWLPRPMVVLALLAGVLGGLAYLIGGFSSRPVSAVIYLPLLAGCLGLSMTLLGLAPGEVIAPEVQHWLFTLLVLTIPLLILVGLVWAFWTGKRPRLRLVLLLAAMFVVLVLMVGFALIAAEVDALGTFPFRWSIPPKDFAEMPAEGLRDAFSSTQPETWPLIQWWAHQGEFVTLGLWLILLMMWQMTRDRRLWQADPETVPTWRDWLGPPLRTSARAATSVCLLLWIVYLAAVPALIEPLENQYQKMAAFGRNPQSHWDEIHQNVEQAKAELRQERGLP